MVDIINDNETPVFLINGFLESGKTAFIKYTMDEEYFEIEGNTLLIVCEEGEVEYDPAELKEKRTFMVVIDRMEDMTAEYLKELQARYHAERIVIEWNGMWDVTRLPFPKDWVLYQQVTLMDGSTLTAYLNNMKSLMGPMLKNSELCIINRCDDKEMSELLDWKRKLRPMLQSDTAVIMENRYGEIPLETLPEELPYDIDSEVIEIKPEDYGVWFFDVKDNPERYRGKAVSFSACLMKGKRFGEGYFVPGRMAMTCCEDDMTFIGFLAHYEGLDAFKHQEWVKLTAKVDIRYRKEYNAEGPVLEVLSMAHTQRIGEPVGF